MEKFFWKVGFGFVAVLACIYVDCAAATAQKQVAPAKAQPAPKATISGVSGEKWDWPRAPRWRGYLKADYFEDKSPVWTISGNGFGKPSADPNKCGSVTTNNIYFRTKLVSWDDKRIVVRLTTDLKATPVEVNLTVVPIGRAAVSTRVKAIPQIHTRVYGQCTHYVALTRLLASKSIPKDSAYSTNLSIDARYVPQSKDVLMWGQSHTAVIGSVSTNVTDDRKGTKNVKYSLRIDQFNVSPIDGEQFSSFPTEVTVKIQYDPKTGKETKRSFVTKTPYQFSGKSGAATGGWR